MKAQSDQKIWAILPGDLGEEELRVPECSCMAKGTSRGWRSYQDNWGVQKWPCLEKVQGKIQVAFWQLSWQGQLLTQTQVVQYSLLPPLHGSLEL